MNPLFATQPAQGLDKAMESLSGWPLAFTIVGSAFAIALLWGTVVTGRWPWDRN